jgi:pseudaminic acid biosynthesis-associated methylase
MDPQSSLWSGEFGDRYTARNTYDADQFRRLYRDRFGIPKEAINQLFLGDLPRDLKVLEVGCNIGFQLLLLEEMGFRSLCGVDLQPAALGRARSWLPGAGFARANALRLPFRDGAFDLVFTNGVLIHIAPERLPQAMGEIARCTRRWVWGFEYFAPGLTNVPYHGEETALWKGDYAKLYEQVCPALKLRREARLRYPGQPELSDAMFLLERT